MVALFVGRKAPGQVEKSSDLQLVEYWAHEASLVPFETHRRLRWRMADQAGQWGSMQRIVDDQPELVAQTLALVAGEGPIRAGQTGFERPDPRRRSAGAGRTPGRQVLSDGRHAPRAVAASGYCAATAAGTTWRMPARAATY